MKFSNILFLEQDQKFDSRRQRDIESFAERSARQSEIEQFLTQNLDSYYGDEEFFRLQRLILNFFQFQDFLDRKNLNEYSSEEDLKNSLNQIKQESLNVENKQGVKKVFENDEYIVVYPENFDTYKLYSWNESNMGTLNRSEVDYEERKMKGRLFFMLPKNTENKNYYSIFVPFSLESNEYIINRGTVKLSNFISEYQDVMSSINEFMVQNFSKIIKIFEDDFLREKYISIQENLIEDKMLKSQEKLRESDAWFGTTIGNMALAAFKYAQDYDKDLKDIYDLFYDGYDWFSTEPNQQGMSFKVMTEKHAEEEVKEYWETYIGETELLDSFSDDFLEDFADTEKIKQTFWETYNDFIRDDHESYFEQDELPISGYDQRKIDRLKQEMKSLQKEIDSEEMSDDDIQTHQERISEIELEIEDLEENADREPTDEMIEEKIDDLWYEYRDKPFQWLREYNADLEDFIDTEELVKWLVRHEDWGNALSSYDGNYDSYYINKILYYVVRVE